MAHLDFEQPLVELEQRIRDLKAMAEVDASLVEEIEELQVRAERARAQIYADLGVWQKVQLSRHPDRPYFRDYLERIFDDFIELHGDRRFSDD
ncbi:MAG: acetyl-CoA carboxylase carboxyl transferase subunit alpha, partial [Myxococcales bacterium]|nr:acetyl-CoA carboxylase carboxyl transferase subunit alpha [Myxococcales bacterium]